MDFWHLPHTRGQIDLQRGGHGQVDVLGIGREGLLGVGQEIVWEVRQEEVLVDADQERRCYVT